MRGTYNMKPTVLDLYKTLDERMPGTLSCPWDNDGIMCAHDLSAPVTRVLCAMDVTDRVIDEAEELGCDCVVSHHPMIFSGMKSIDPATPAGARIIRLIEKKITVLSFHTRLDAVEGGVNDTLCETLHMTRVDTFGTDGEALGRVATLPAPIPFASFAMQVKEALGCGALQCVSAKKPVSRVAVLGGSGKDDWQAALSAGADTYLTGEMNYHAMLDAKEAGLNVIAAGHFPSERPVTHTLAKWVREAFPSVEAFVSETGCELLTV